MKAIVVVSVAILVCSCIGCRNTKPDLEVPSTRIDPTNAYSLFAGIAEPAMVPGEVADLQADGAVWMDMHILCRFRAPAQLIDAIVARGYHRTNWDGVVTAMHAQYYTNSFVPAWNPDDVSTRECYFQRVKRDHGTDMLHLMVDRQTGLVYAVAEGEAHD
jgi:hypothetical protein